MRNRPFLAALGLALAVAAAFSGCGGDGGSGSGLPTATIRVGNTSLKAEVARTAAEQEQGLGYRDSLPAESGMLFVFSRSARQVFWMKGMRFALDFIWIGADDTVHEVTPNVRAEPGVADAQLRRYQPQSDVQYVLEVNQGFAARHGISPGDPVDLSAIRTLPPP